jgi:HK97 family phage major capsid protein
MPAGTGGNPYPLLKGRPVLVVEQCQALGTVGDIVLIDPSQYIVVDAGMNTALSVHARFDNDEVVFRFTWRIDGKGAYSTQITPYNGSQTRSPFIVLAAR